MYVICIDKNPIYVCEYLYTARNILKELTLKQLNKINKTEYTYIPEDILNYEADLNKNGIFARYTSKDLMEIEIIESQMSFYIFMTRNNITVLSKISIIDTPKYQKNPELESSENILSPELKQKFKDEITSRVKPSFS